MHRGLAHSCAQSAGLPMLFTSVQANRAGQEKGWGQHGRRQRHHSRAMGPATLALPGFYRMICILAGWPEQLIASAGLSTLICETRTEKSLLRGLSRTLNDKKLQRAPEWRRISRQHGRPRENDAVLQGL
ncbi:PREDICTED: uncharacterized protein LOC106149110 isoform X2 [Chinchilla lanigera]|uniref:uncharacterized protein LOC106149110 isoform X2 n=1 Tax=Chinchilla lanigera TaxID=34839 RepID=UPI000696A697|nr:PREDICTED: uncharacterized protein LOC106149110 isoform X2 [Chinchilla lanigera]